MKRLRSGFTTGTCSAAAAKAAAHMLKTGKNIENISIITPKGTKAFFELYEVSRSDGLVRCGVKKDAGDDPDVTDKTMVYAVVSYIGKDTDKSPEWYEDRENGLYLTGGEGIGIVTKAGLACPVGKHAVNPVPRKMIFDAVADEIPQSDREVLITIEIPDGVMLAEKTFNPKLGIKGGISVLGTSGVVEPMSEQAVIDTIRIEIHMKAVEGKESIILTPGNYGEAFLREHTDESLEDAVKCSNFIADALEISADEKIRNILLAGHIGKLIKVAGGVRNTHSGYGDRRMEIMADCALACGADQLLLKQIGKSNTTEEAIEYMTQAGITNNVMQEVVKRIKKQAELWTDGRCKIEVLTFSSVCGLLCRS